MPNWCECELRISGPKDTLREFRAAMRTEGERPPSWFEVSIAQKKGEEPPKSVHFVEEFDFNVGVKMPEELRSVQSGSMTINGERHDHWRDENGVAVPVDVRELVVKYGAADWYEWSVENWGTKWNASDVSWETDGFVRFNTAWSPPNKVIVALSRKWPTLIFTLKAWEGGAGFRTCVRARNGNLLLDFAAQYSGPRGG